MLLRKGRTPNRSWLKGLQLNHNPQIATSREFRTIFAVFLVRKVLLWLRRVRLWHPFGCNLRGFDTFGGLESGVVGRLAVDRFASGGKCPLRQMKMTLAREL